MNNEEVLIKTYYFVFFFVLGGFFQFAFGLLGVVSVAITMIIVGILEAKGIIDWGKFLPK